LPLEFFDDPTRYELRTPQSLLKDKKDPNFYLEAFSKYHYILPDSASWGNGGWKWTKCRVLEYNEETELFKIEWEDSRKQKWVRRFNLLFPGEKLADVSQRMEQASKTREIYEERNLSVKMIESSTLEDMAPFPESLKLGIFRRLGRRVQKSERKFVEQLLQELNGDYIFAMKKTDYYLKNKIVDTTHSSVYSEKFAQSVLVQSGAVGDDISKVLLGKVANAAKGLSEHMFSANAELQAVLLDVLSCLRRIITPEQDFFSFSLNALNDIKSFSQRARLNCESVQAKLVNEWPRSICSIIESRLNDYFNFQENNLKKYMENRSRSFLHLVNAVMEGQLHNLIVSAAIKYLGLFSIGVETRGDISPPTMLDSAFMNYSPTYDILKPGPPLRIISPFLRVQINVKCPWSLKPTPPSLEELQIHPQNEIDLFPRLDEIEPLLLELLYLPAKLTENVVPNVESILLTRLSLPTTRFVKSIDPKNEQVSSDGGKALSELMAKVRVPINQLLQDYKQFEFLIRENVAEQLGAKSPLEEFDKPIQILTHAKVKLQQVSLNSVEFPPIVIDCSMIKEALENLTNSAFDFITDLLASRIEKQCSELLARYEPLSINIKIDPGLVAQWWSTLQTSISSTTNEIGAFHQQFGDVQKTWNIMYNYNMVIPEDIQHAYWTTYRWPSRISDDLEDARSRLDQSRIHILRRIEREIGYVIDSTETFLSELEFFELLGDVDQLINAKRKLSKLNDLVESTVGLSASVNKQEVAMGLEETRFDDLQDGITRFGQYKSLWELVEDVQQHLNDWVNEWFMNLNAELMYTKVAQWNSIINDCESWYDLDTNPRIVTTQVKEDVDDFWRNTNVVAILRNPALKETHWKKIHEIIGLSLVDFQGLRLVHILDLDLELVQSVISDICNSAEATYKLELNLDRMKNELTVGEFRIGTTDDISITQFLNLAEASQLLEDQMMQCESIYAKLPEIESKQKFEKWLNQIQKALSMVKAVEALQDFHLRMQPLLRLVEKENSTVQKEIEESIHSCFKANSVAMDVFGKNRKFINLVYRSDLYDMMVTGKGRIEAVLDAIKPLLHKSREVFPRFFFVDDISLIETLSCNSPNQLSKFIPSFFPSCFKLMEGTKTKTHRRSLKISAASGIERKGLTRSTAFQKSPAMNKGLLQKVANDLQIKTMTGIVSHDGDMYTFKKPIEMNGYLPDELKELEIAMSQSLKELTVDAHIGYQKSLDSGNLRSFLEKYPLQTVMLILRIELSKKLLGLAKSSEDDPLLNEFRHALEDMMNEAIEINRTASSISLKMKIEAVLLMILQYKNDFEDCKDMQRLKAHFMMFLFDEEQTVKLSSLNMGPVSFGYEILGMDSRLVLTPQMQSQFIQIFGAVCVNRNVLAIGPHSSGKTGTIQEFGSIVGYRTVVYFCSEMNPYRLANVLQGSSLTNTWLILKNLHHLNENLQGLISPPTNTLTISSKECHVPKTKTLFATIPSIREWKSFTPNLRNSFKIFGLLQPDYQYILRALLVINGFRNTEVLVKKLLILMDNTRMLLPTKMNLNKAQQILRIASQLRSQNPNLNELGLIRQAAVFVFKSHISTSDLGVLKETMHSIFKHPSEDAPLSRIPLSRIQETIKSMQLISSDSLAQKVSSFFKYLESRTPIFIYGDTLTSKSTVWKIASNLVNQMLPANCKVNINHCFPRSFCSLNSLAPSKSKNIEFRHLLSSARNHCTEMETKFSDIEINSSFGWIIFDGEQKSSWFDSIDGMIGEFDSSETDKGLIQIVYESKNVADASPKIINRSSLVYIEPKMVKPEMIIHHLLSKSPPNVFQMTPFISLIFQLIVFPAIKHMQSDFTWAGAMNTDRIAVIRVFNMFMALLKEKGVSGYERLTTQEQCVWVIYAFLFSTIWTIGADISYEKRCKFDQFFKSHINELARGMEDFESAANLPAGYLKGLISFPEDLSVFEVYVDEKVTQWTEWMDQKSNMLASHIPNEMVVSKELRQSCFLIHLLVSQNIPVIISGMPGVGKSSIAEAACKICSLQSSQTFEQDYGMLLMTGDVDLLRFKRDFEQLIPKKRFNARGSALGKRKIVFIDNIDFFNNQEGIWDTFRMYFENGNYYSSDGEHEALSNLQIIGTYQPGNKREYLYSQWARYFSIVNLHDNESEKVKEIMWSQMLNKLRPTFSTETISKVLDASMAILDGVRQLYRRTPMNPQYLFTMNNVLVWLHALIHFPVGQSSNELLYQWIHCSHRIFRDRITTNVESFDKLVDDVMGRIFNVDLGTLTGHEPVCAYIQPDVLVSGRKNDLKVKDYKLVIKSLKYKSSWMAELEPDKILYRQALEMACYSAFVVQNMSKHFVFAGIDYGNRHMIVKLAAQMTKRKLFSFDEFQQDDWSKFLREIFVFLKERARAVLIFMDSRYMTNEVWTDVLRIVKAGTPVNPDKHFEIGFEFNPADILKRIRICISFPNMEDSENLELLTRYPIILNYATLHYATEIKAASVEDFIENQLSLRPLSSYIESGNIGAFLSWLKQDLPVFLRANFPFESQLYYHVPESVFTLISTFFRLHSNHHDEKVTTMEKIKEAIECIEAGFESIRRTQEEYDTHMEGISNHATETETVLSEIESERLLLDDLYMKLKTEKEALVKNQEEVAYLRHFCVNEVEKLMPSIEEAVRKVQTLTRGDIYELKGLVEPSATVLLVMESVVLLLKFELKAGESSWNAVKRMISERGFIANASSAMQESFIISQIALHTVDRLQKSDAYNSLDLTNTAALILREWALFIAKLHNLRYALIPKKKLLQDTEVRIQTREAHIVDLEQEIKAHESEVNFLKQKFQQLVKRNETATFRVKEVEVKLSTANGISPSLQILKEKLMERNQYLEQSLGSLVSTCLIAACAVSLLGCFSATLRRELIKRWNHGLTRFDLPDLPANFNISDVLGPKLNPDPATVDMCVYETLLMAKNHHKFPIIIDPYCLTVSAIKSVEKDGHIVIIYHYDTEHTEKICNAMLHGSIVVFIVSTNTVFSDIQKIVRMIKSPSVDQKTSPDFERFRIYFVLTGELQLICSKSAWTPDFAPFKVFYFPEAVQTKIADAICATHDVDLRQKLSSKKNELHQSIAKREMFLSRVTEFAAKLTEEDIYGGDLYKTMIDIQSQLDAIIFKVKHAEKSLNVIVTEFAPYELAGSALSQIYGLVHDMKNISSSYLYNFEDFLEVCREKVSILGSTLVHEDLRKFCEEVYKTVYFIVAPGYKQVDRLVFTTFFALTISKIDLFSKDSTWKLNVAHLRYLIYAIADPLIKRPANVKNNCKSWLSDPKWDTILELTKLPTFQNFAIEFAKFGNRATTPVTEASWQEINDAKDPSKVDFPSRWQMYLNRAERMLVTRAIRPDALPNLLEDICKTIIGDVFLDHGFPSDLLHQRLQVSSVQKPIIVYSHDLEDAIYGINQLASRFLTEHPWILTPGIEESSWLDQLPQITSKGSWLVVNLIGISFHDYDLLFSKLFGTIKALSNISSHFRVWIVCPSEVTLPANLVCSAVQLSLEEERDFRCIFHESFMVICSKAEQIKHTKNYYLRKTLFNMCAIFAIIKFRMRCYPLVVDNYIDMQYADLKVACQYIFEFFEEFPNQTSGSKEMLYWYVFERVWGSQILSSPNMRWFTGLFLEMINITWPSSEDKSEKSNQFPPLRAVYECYCADEFRMALEKIGEIPRGFQLQVDTFGHGENILLFLEGQKMMKIQQSAALLKPEIANFMPKSGFAFELVVKLLSDFRTKLINETLYSWYTTNEIKPNRMTPSRGEKVAPKSLESLAKFNFHRYKRMLQETIDLVNFVLKQLNGEEILESTTVELAKEIMDNHVPIQWKLNQHFYKSALPFSLWTSDFIARLQFMRVWYTSKYEGKASDALIYLDISKLFAPEDLIPSIIMEASHQMNEPIENLELETIFVSERQKNTPERGCYVIGLHLYGASFDTHKNALRNARPSEVSTRFPCVLDVNVGLVHAKIEVEFGISQKGLHNDSAKEQKNHFADPDPHLCVQNIQQTWQFRYSWSGRGYIAFGRVCDSIFGTILRLLVSSEYLFGMRKASLESPLNSIILLGIVQHE
jgi:hypothetical protein